MYGYTAYRLGVHSELPLPELVPSEMTPDITVCLRRLDRSVPASLERENCLVGETANVGSFLVQDGRQILIDPAPEVDEARLRTTLLGPVLAVLLRQRGLLVLHASSISVHHSAIAFLGGSGSGKSTLAMALYARGYGLLVDDVMAVHVGLGPPVVLPSYPHVKLWPEAAAALGYAVEKLPRLHPESEKRSCHITLGFPQRALPLARIYVLEVSTQNVIEPLQPQEAFRALVRNSRAMGVLKTPAVLNAHLRQCARLVAEVPIVRLKRQRSLLALSEIVRVLEDDLAQVTPVA